MAAQALAGERKSAKPTRHSRVRLAFQVARRASVKIWRKWNEDREGFKFFHLRGLLLTDGLASLVAAGLLFFFLGKSLRRPAAPEPVINSAAG